MRKLMWFTLGFGAACAFCAYSYVDWMLLLGITGAIGAVAFAVACRWYSPLRIVSMVCVGIALGISWFYSYDALFLADARAADAQTMRSTIIVTDYSYETDRGCAFHGEVEIGEHRYKIRVYLNETVLLEPGNRVIGEFKYATVIGSGVDVTHHQGNGVFLTASQRSNVVVERFWSVPWRLYPVVWGHRIAEVLVDVFPKDVRGFALALLLGDRSQIDYETNTAFKISGISHIIAVSGLHVSILLALVYLITGRRRFLTSLIGIPIVLCFMSLVGFSPSVTRAGIMQILMMLSMAFEREYDQPTSLAFSALTMFMINPMVVTSVSFQLSFACMMGIILMNVRIKDWLMDGRRLGVFRGKWVNWLASGIAVSVSASALTTPLVAIHFGCISLISVLTNLLTVWAISFIFYGIILACFAGAIHIGAGSVVAWVVAWPIRYVLRVSDILSQMPLSAVYTKSAYITAWLIFAYILLGIFLLGRRKHAFAYIGVTVLSLCLCVALSWAEPLLDDYRMTMLDVGQGQAILLQGDGNTYLVDCGGDYDEGSADIVAETLLSQGIDRLDGIILTHYDRDHAGGVPYLLTRIDVDLILLPHSLDDSGVSGQLAAQAGDQIQIVKEDLLLSFGATQITVFAPISYNSGNESSMSVLFHHEKCDILITGDMGAEGERLLMKYHQLPQVDVLVAGHHGSKHSTSQALLDEVRPQYVFISVGENSYGHPAEVILKRLEAMGCIIYRTDEDGTIIFRG